MFPDWCRVVPGKEYFLSTQTILTSKIREVQDVRAPSKLAGV
jgi:hypothetical protein